MVPGGWEDPGSGVRQDIHAARDAYAAGGDLTVHNYYAAGARPAERAAGGRVVAGDVPQQPPGFVPRADLLGVLDAAGPGVAVVSAVTGMRGVGKTQLAAAYARAKLAEGWGLVAWVNAEDPAALAGGLAAVAEAAGLAGQDGDPGRVVRHWLEAGGDRCLLVFDDATDPDLLQPYLPAGGAARVLITSNRQSVADLGTRVGVEVFTMDEAVAFLAGRTGLADPAGAGELAAELGYLPLALTQAAAVIRGQHLAYETYLGRLRALPVEQYLRRGPGQPYPHGVAETVLLSLQAVREGDQTGACGGVLELLSVLSAAGVRRDLLHAAGQADVLAAGGEDRLDEALGRLAEWSLLAFSLDGQAVLAHRLVLRVVRDTLAAQGRLAAVCRAAASVLGTRASALEGSLDRQAVRDVPEQVRALLQVAAGLAGGPGELEEVLLRLRLWAMYHLTCLGDSAAQAIAVGERAIEDVGRVLGPDHPHTLTSRNNLANAYQTGGPDTPRRSCCTSRPWSTANGCSARTTPTPWPRGTTSPTPTRRRAGTPRRSCCTSRPWPTGSGCSARTTPTPWPRGTTSPTPTRTRAGSPTRSRCTSRPWPTASGCSARTTPAPWPRGTTSPRPTRTRAGPPRRSRCTSRPWPTASGCSARTTPTP